MKKGMIILLIISLVILNGLIKVKASTIPGWASNLPSLSRVDFYDCNSSGCETAIHTANEGLSTDYGNRDMIVTTSQVSIAKNGVKIAYPFIQKKGYLYQSIFYICSSTNINNSTFEIYSSVAGNTKNHNNIFNDTAYATMNNVPGDGSQSFNSCRQIIGIVVPENDNLWFNVRMTSNNTIKTYMQVVAVETKELGLYTDTIRQIVENANGNVVDAVDKVNDTLNQNHEYNNNASQNTENEKQQMENYEQEEDTLRKGLDLNIEESEITINPEANTFIWNIVDRLRGMSGKIVLLFTSVLSLGIMKMILGR